MYIDKLKELNVKVEDPSNKVKEQIILFVEGDENDGDMSETTNYLSIEEFEDKLPAISAIIQGDMSNWDNDYENLFTAQDINNKKEVDFCEKLRCDLLDLLPSFEEHIDSISCTLQLEDINGKRKIIEVPRLASLKSIAIV